TPLQICFVYLYKCNEARIEGNRFIHGAQGANPNGAIFTFWADSGKMNRYENNLFQNFAGVVIGYLNAQHKHEESAQFVGNKLDNGALYTTVYTVIRNGVIANNSFSNMSSGALILQNDLLENELTSNLAITGNSIQDCGFGIRTDSGGSAEVLPMQDITITGNVIERCQFYGISITKAIGLTIAGNVIRDCDIAHIGSAAVVLNGVSDAVVNDNVIAWTREEAPNGCGLSFSTYFAEARDIVIDGNSIIGYAVGISGGTDPAHPSYVCSETVISNNLIRCRQAASGDSHGIHIYQLTQGTRIFSNRVEGALSWAFITSSTCQLSDNLMTSIYLDNTYDPNITYYWEEEKGRKTYRPDNAAPTTPPTGVTWKVGDLQYNNGFRPLTMDFVLSVGDPVGWIYTGATLGWRAFGVIV
ncbi:MAG: right-handed parallel beta-helix repeat-containing protein, partial [Byssovorax sp.]